MHSNAEVCMEGYKILMSARNKHGCGIVYIFLT